jgi:RsiW-degrading membrane proteinase PrsW (M82 family)
MTLFNQFSGVVLYLIVGIGLLVVILRRVATEKRQVAVLVGTAVLLFGGLLLFQPATGGATAVTVQQTLAEGGHGRPVLLELYSDY